METVKNHFFQDHHTLQIDQLFQDHNNHPK